MISTHPHSALSMDTAKLVFVSLKIAKMVALFQKLSKSVLYLQHEGNKLTAATGEANINLSQPGKQEPVTG